MRRGRQRRQRGEVFQHHINLQYQRGLEHDMLCEPSTPLSPCSHHLDAGLGGPPEQPAPPFRGDGSSSISGFHASDQKGGELTMWKRQMERGDAVEGVGQSRKVSRFI